MDDSRPGVAKAGSALNRPPSNSGTPKSRARQFIGRFRYTFVHRRDWALVVPVAEQLGERELQDALLEPDRLLDETKLHSRLLTKRPGPG